mgnify:FL=1|jgi:hypothetical protein
MKYEGVLHQEYAFNEKEKDEVYGFAVFLSPRRLIGIYEVKHAFTSSML